MYVASEMKGADRHLRQHRGVSPPGHYQTSESGGPQRYYNPDWRAFEQVEAGPADPAPLREALEQSVHRHMMSDVPYGVLLSGGLDSSLIAALTAKYAAKRTEDDDRSDAWWPRLHTFSIGLEGSPDLAAAKTVADALGTVHHSFHFTVQEGLDALSDVIRHVENLRRHHHSCVHADVPDGAAHSRHGHQDGVCPVKAPTKFSAAICTSTWRRTIASFTRNWCASSTACTTTTACAPTSRWRPGAWRHACRSWIASSWTWPCEWAPSIKRPGNGRIEKNILREGRSRSAA